MKKQKHVFNEALRRYNKYLRKLDRLIIGGRNKHRQGVLRRHIERLKGRLSSLYISIKGATVIAAVSALCMVAAPDANAQTSFGSVQQNPFGLTYTGDRFNTTLGDLDDDGDMDLIAGDGTRFSYYENLGTNTTPSFGSEQLNPFGLQNIPSSYITPSLIDLDDDGDLDIMLGANEYFYYIENTGTKSAPSFGTVQESPFGLPSVLGSVGYYFDISFADLDADGDFDMISGEKYGQFIYFENTGTKSAPSFGAAQGNPFGLSSIRNSYSSPSFIDIDLDGDMDILMGQYDGSFSYYENIGTSTTPSFGAVQLNPFGLTTLGYYNSTPSFADLDADGDMDMMAGDEYGNFNYFENTSPIVIPPYTPCFGSEQLAPLFGGLASPEIDSNMDFVDLDNDGDLDVMSGGASGNFTYFQNTGTIDAPAFSSGVTNPFSLIGIGTGYTSKVAFCDLDNDGDIDMLSGEAYGNFKYFENTGTAPSPSFAPSLTNPFSLTKTFNYRSDPSFGDIDGDGDFDMIAGDFSGNFFYYQNTGTASTPSFAARVDNPFTLTDIGTASAVAIVDIDNDGDLDLLGGEYTANTHFYENIGSATSPSFAAAVLNPFSLVAHVGDQGYNRMSFGDLDNDGDLDLLATSYSSIRYLENLALPIRATWDGETSTDWDTATNWIDDVLPVSTDAVLICDTTNDPIITSDVEVKSLHVATGAVITVSTNSLKVTNDIALNGGMTVTSGASLVPLGTVAGLGTATIYRNTTFGVTEGRYSVIGSPTDGGITDVLGSIVYSYDETVAYDPGGTAGGARFISVASPEAIAVGDAYFSANTGSISFIGTPNSGTISVPLVYNETNDGGATHSGFNLVSNPYPASILFPAFVSGNPDIDGAIYVWDDGGSDIGTRTNADYIVATTMGITGGSGRIGNADGYIRSTQGFFVKATTAGTLNFTPSMMATTNNSDSGFFREEKPTVLRISLSSDDMYSDILVGFSKNTTNEFDRTYDAYKFKGNDLLQLSSKMGESNMAIQALPVVESETKVDLEFDMAKSGTYTFKLEEASKYGFEVFLKDNLLGKLIDLSENNSYLFESASVSNSDRFSLVFSPNAILDLDEKVRNNDMIVFSNGTRLIVRMKDKLSNATVSIYNLSGILVKEVKQINFTRLDWTTSFNDEGLFIITVLSEGKLFVKKFIK